MARAVDSLLTDYTEEKRIDEEELQEQDRLANNRYWGFLRHLYSRDKDLATPASASQLVASCVLKLVFLLINLLCVCASVATYNTRNPLLVWHVRCDVPPNRYLINGGSLPELGPSLEC